MHPGSGSVSKGRGVGAPSETHCAKRPSLHPCDETQEDDPAAATRKNIVIVQHVKAITFIGRVTVMVSINVAPVIFLAFEGEFLLSRCLSPLLSLFSTVHKFAQNSWPLRDFWHKLKFDESQKAQNVFHVEALCT